MEAQHLKKHYELPTYVIDFAALARELRVAMFVAQELSWWEAEIEPYIDEP